MTCDIRIEREAVEFSVKRNNDELGTLTEEWAERLKAAVEREDIHEMVHQEEEKMGRKLTLAEIMQLLEELLEDPFKEAHKEQRLFQAQ